VPASYIFNQAETTQGHNPTPLRYDLQVFSVQEYSVLYFLMA